MKWVKQRAMTINKRREVEMAKQAGEEVMQGLYSESQTMIYRPAPIQDVGTSSRRKTDYCRARSLRTRLGISICMRRLCFRQVLPIYHVSIVGCAALHGLMKLDKGIAKVAKQLKISYAEACTGFEFKKQRAIPVITGIVVAENQAPIVMDAYWESTAAAEEREKQKRMDKALKRWGKLVNALRVRQRLRAQYGDAEGVSYICLLMVERRAAFVVALRSSAKD
jgi:xeroderma pigmentosum group C-complementing protein